MRNRTFGDFWTGFVGHRVGGWPMGRGQYGDFDDDEGGARGTAFV